MGRWFKLKPFLDLILLQLLGHFLKQLWTLRRDTVEFIHIFLFQKPQSPLAFQLFWSLLNANCRMRNCKYLKSSNPTLPKNQPSMGKPANGVTQPLVGKYKAWSKRLRLLPFNIFNRVKIFIVRIDFAETMTFHKYSIVGVNEINILSRIKDKGVCQNIFIRNE